MAEGITLSIDESALRRFVPEFLRKSRLIPATLRHSQEERAKALVEELRAATPYRPGDADHEHARDGWVVERRGPDTAVANHVDHIEWLLKGNHANSPDGLIHPTQAQALHFYDGGTEVFTHGVHPMHADAHLVEAWDHAQHDAASFEHQVAVSMAGALHVSNLL